MNSTFGKLFLIFGTSLGLTACGSFNNPFSGARSVDYGTTTLNAVISTGYLSPIPTVTGNKLNAPVSFSISPALPTGLTLIETTGQIAGAATVSQSAMPYTVTASFSGVTASSTVNLSIGGGTPPSAFVYSDPAPTYPSGALISPNVPVVTGGTPTFTYSITQSGGSAGDTLCTDTGGVFVASPRSCTGGLIIDLATGYVTGTPTIASMASKVYTVTLDNGTTPISATITITVTAVLPPTGLSYLSNNASYPKNLLAVNAPTNTGGTPAAGNPTYPFAYQITTSGGSAGDTLCVDTGGTYNPSPRSCTGGMLIDQVSGIISGTPTTNALNPKVYRVVAANTGGSTFQDITISVISGTPSAFTYPTLAASYPTGSAITTANPSTSDPATYSISPNLCSQTGSSPCIDINTTTGAISGTPSATQVSTLYTVTKTNALGSITTTFNLATTLPAPTGLSYAQNNVDYTINSTVVNNAATVTGSGITWSSVPTLPSGLTFNASGNIVGTPTALTNATALTPATARVTYVVTATNTGGSTTANVTFSVVHQSPTAFTYANITGVPAGTAITAVFPSNPGGNANNAITRYYMDASTPLPSGLLIDSAVGGNGRIYGTPAAYQADTTYTLHGTNSSGVVVDYTLSLHIQVNDAAPVGLAYTNSSPNGPGQNRCTAAAFKHGDNISLSPSISGGGAVTSYAINSGSIPAGWNFSTSTGVIDSGGAVALNVGNGYHITSPTLTIRGTNASGNSTSTNICIEVVPTNPTALGYTTTTPTYTVGTAITTNSPTVTGGLPAGSLTYTTTAPSGTYLNGATMGLTLNADGTITGTPTALAWPSQAVTVQVSNSAYGGGSTTRAITMVVQDRPPGAFSYTPLASYNRYYAMTALSPSAFTPPTSVGAVTYAISPLSPTSAAAFTAAGFSIASGTGVITGTPTASLAGNVIVRATATSSPGTYPGFATDSSAFTLNVVNSAADLTQILTGQTPGGQASPVNFATSSSNVTIPVYVRNRAALGTGPLTIDITATGATETNFFSIVPGGTCDAGLSCTNVGGYFMHCNNTGGTSNITYSGAGPTAFTGAQTCYVNVVANYGMSGIASPAAKTATLTITPSTGTAATISLTGATNYQWVAQTGYDSASTYGTNTIPSGGCSPQGSTITYLFSSTPTTGTQWKMSRLAGSDSNCAASPSGPYYYQLDGTIQDCGGATTWLGASGGVCESSNSMGTFYSNFKEGTPQYTPGACDTTKKYITQVYKCQ